MIDMHNTINIVKKPIQSTEEIDRSLMDSSIAFLKLPKQRSKSDSGLSMPLKSPNVPTLLT